MSSTLKNAAVKALAAYKEQAERAGFQPGVFTRIRHNTKNLPAAVTDLLAEVSNTDSDEECAKLLHEFLGNPKTSNNNHSFARYLIDELRKAQPNGTWEQYDPKLIIFFQGTLYHGTNVECEIIFDEGLIAHELGDKDLKSFYSPTSGSRGVSTAKKKKAAQGYAIKNITPKIGIAGDMVMTDVKGLGKYGYVYEIDYCAWQAIDIDATAKAQGKDGGGVFKKEIGEVNVLENIPRHCIKRCWVYERRSKELVRYEENPRYDLCLATNPKYPNNAIEELNIASYLFLIRTRGDGNDDDENEAGSSFPSKPVKDH